MHVLSLLLILVCVELMRPVPVAVAEAEPPVAVEEGVSSPVATLYKAVSQCRPSLAEAERWRIAAAINDEGGRYGYDPLFVLAMAEVESSCSPTAVGEGGSLGLFQLMPSTGRALAREAGIRWQGTRTLTNPALNIRLGLRYLSKLERQFRHPYLAMAAYNMGPGRVMIMPREQARSSRYVRKVLGRYEHLLKRHGAVRT
jgi:soluble lytic murein transglycosylase